MAVFSGSVVARVYGLFVSVSVVRSAIVGEAKEEMHLRK